MVSSHVANHIHHPTLNSDNTLHVVAVVSNPARWHSRIRLAREFVERMKATPNVKLHVVECAFGDRQHELDADLELRSNTSLWIKESMINLGVKRLLPHNWKYVAWVDMDVTFNNPHWAQEALHELQHYALIQPFSQCIDLGLHGDAMATYDSFGLVHAQGVRMQTRHDQPYKLAHTGYAWCATRKLWERVNGLPDHCILGSADHHAAFGAVGNVHMTLPEKCTQGYKRRLQEWAKRAIEVTHCQVGYVPGTIMHHYHGKKADRQYQSRWSIILDNNFDPDKDLYYDEQGLIATTNHKLNHAVYKYSASRNEDAT